jgi:hypothetical protein
VVSSDGSNMPEDDRKLRPERMVLGCYVASWCEALPKASVWRGGYTDERSIARAAQKRQSRQIGVKRQEPTPRITKSIATDFAIAHGIGIVLLKLNALLTCTTFAKNTSKPPSKPDPRNTLKRLHARIFATRLRPARAGSASSPCDLIRTATLGTAVSKSRNTSAGNM